MQPFLEGLADMHPPSPEVEAVIEKAKTGTYDAPADRGATPDDELNLAFVRGLGALSKGEVAQAAAWFQQTLKGASDFLGAAFYLGATHAASGRDKEAIGAWEMALLSENPGAVYPVLVDALLRTGRRPHGARHPRGSAGGVGQRQRAAEARSDRAGDARRLTAARCRS